ncbi:MAG: ComF family protein [Acidimicrobiia bacterium]
MVCLACGRWGRSTLCPACGRSLSPAPDLRLPGGLLVRSAYLHSGAARVLVHRLKYQGLLAAALPLARAMAERVPEEVRLLVPVPRARLRAWRYGVDQASALAAALAAELGLPVRRPLHPPWWAHPHAGRPRQERPPSHFTRSEGTERGIALVDDVVTTGTTLRGAEGALRGSVIVAVTATAARVPGTRVSAGAGTDASPSSRQERPVERSPP